MSIRAKVLGCLIAILLLFGGVSAYNYRRASHSEARLILVNELFLPLSRQIAQLQSNIQGLAEDMWRFHFQAEASPDQSTFSRMVRDLYPYLIRKKFAAAELMLSKQEKGALSRTVTELEVLLKESQGKFDALVASADRAAFEIHYRDLRGKLQALSRRVDDECQNVTLQAQKEGKEHLFTSLFLSAAVVLLGVLTVVASHQVLAPLPTLIQSIRKIADGDFNQSLKIKAGDKDETALLAREYNRMLAALSERDRKIQNQQKELLQSERLAAVGQLSAEVVHEIRNPLNAVSLNIDWLENELGGSDPEVAKTLKSISREIARLGQITESYLVRARTPHVETQKTPVHDLIQEILDFSREEDRARNIAVDTKFSGQEIFVRTDRSRLKQAFLNVFRNAKEAMPRGGKLVVRTEIKENVSRIQISDSGYGMNEATRGLTFQPFFTTKANGTGLGLTLTKSIVEEAHGSIHCDSQMGKGTIFTFQFPI